MLEDGFMEPRGIMHRGLAITCGDNTLGGGSIPPPVAHLIAYEYDLCRATALRVIVDLETPSTHLALYSVKAHGDRWSSSNVGFILPYTLEHTEVSLWVRSGWSSVQPAATFPLSRNRLEAVSGSTDCRTNQ
jgi:hypothetical protein